ncbi:hypothetical protein SIO70_08980 [Chitinophaga sancti]|uniref:hypothetical protein n=1 Tax=Chitinophaga sancti TaxID=1004 RepID=UPI002A75BB7A|nr:hypothetical protein [Chitinophaga sancti]WPQ64984.1 hypothetical protein SIO70_08980 [Chitinophaga sancti]
MSYTKNDMVYDDYSWTTRYTNDDPKVTGEPDSTLLNRKEGWEMLYFINKCGEKWNWAQNSIEAYKKLEKTIRQKVPSDIRSQQRIKTWIEENYKSFWNTI